MALNSCQSITAPSYTLTYDGNGSTGGSVPIDPESYAQGATVTVLGNSGGLVNTGFDFAGWNTKADGTGATYAQDSTFAMGDANTTLFAHWTAPLTRQGLVGEWLFSGNADDTGGYGLNGTISGATLTADRNGKANSAYSFDGNDDISIPDNAVFDFKGGDFTLSMWFKIPDVTGHKSLFAGETDFWFGLFVNDARMNYFVSGNGTSWNLVCGDDGPLNGAGSIALSANAWHHVVFMRSGTSWRGLIDKVEDLSLTPIAGTLTTRNESRYFGRWGNNSNAYRMVGSLDDVRIYNRALSDDEVLALFEEGQ